MKNMIFLLLFGLMPIGVFADANEDLLKAVKSGSVEGVKDALKKGAAVFASDNGKTTFDLAVSENHLDVLEFLLQNVKNPSVNQKEILSDTLVILARKPGTDEKRAKIAKLLLRSGANPNHHHCLDGDTALTEAAASRRGTIFMQVLLSNGAKVNLRTKGQHKSSKTPLMMAAYDGGPEEMKLLLKNGTDINATDDTGHSALMWAVIKPNTSNIKLLIEQKANLNIKTKAGWTALNLADKSPNPDMATLLRAAGAKETTAPVVAQAKPSTVSDTASSTPRICLAFDATGALTCRDMPGSSCPGNRFWAGPGPCSSYNNKKVQQLNKSEWGSLISAFNGEAEDRNKVDEPKQQSKEERCQKACRQKKCGSKLSGEYTASVSASLRCAGFCDQECSTNPGRYR